MSASSEPSFTLGIGGLAAHPWLRLGERVFPLKAPILAHGIDFPLTEGLFRVSVALAAARVRSGGDWVSAEALAEKVHSTPSRVSSLLARALCDRNPPEGRLIEWEVEETKGGGRRGGRSVGGYRIALPARLITMDLEASDVFLAGGPVKRLVLSSGGFAALQRASDVAGEGSFAHGVSLIRAALRAVESGEDDTIRGVDRLMFQARAFEYMSNLQMEMGAWEEGIASAKRALSLYGKRAFGDKRRLGHPEGRAAVLQIMAHLYGQMATAQSEEGKRRFYEDCAFYRASESVAMLKNCGEVAAKDRMRRAVYRGVYGQRCSQGRRLAQAVAPLSYARRVAHEEGVLRWEAIWSLRIAQNAILRADFATAEDEMDRAISLSPHMTVAGNAALHRAKAELFIAKRSWVDAEDALKDADELGVKFGMEHQKREVERLREGMRDKRRR
ncbi:MAG: hypothetical protein U0441_27230 [Polyangiaceae bacterium]